MNCENCKKWSKDDVYLNIGICSNVINLHEFIKKSEKNEDVRGSFIPLNNTPLFTHKDMCCSSHKNNYVKV